VKEEYIQLICNPYGDDSSVNTRVTIDIMDRDISRDELIEVLDKFVRAIGYQFKDDECLGIEKE
jgi:hypothetical protein